MLLVGVNRRNFKQAAVDFNRRHSGQTLENIIFDQNIEIDYLAYAELN